MGCRQKSPGKAFSLSSSDVYRSAHPPFARQKMSGQASPEVCGGNPKIPAYAGIFGLQELTILCRAYSFMV